MYISYASVLSSFVLYASCVQQYLHVAPAHTDRQPELSIHVLLAPTFFDQI